MIPDSVEPPDLCSERSRPGRSLPTFHPMRELEVGGECMPARLSLQFVELLAAVPDASVLVGIGRDGRTGSEAEEPDEDSDIDEKDVDCGPSGPDAL